MTEPNSIDTDLATSENFYTKTNYGTDFSPAHGDYPERPAEAAPLIDFNRRWDISGPDPEGVISALVNVPSAFGDVGYRNGLIALVRTSDYSLRGGGGLRAFIHPPASKVTDYGTGWTALPVSRSWFSTDPWVGAHTPLGFAASQRSGSRVYFFLNDSVVRMSSAGHVDTVYSGTDTRLVGDDNPDFFVSDDPVPVIWRLTHHYFEDLWNDTEVNCFRDDGSPLGSIYPRAGQLGAYYQEILRPPSCPPNVDTPACLVLPWSTAQNPPPELWFLVPEFKNGSKTGSQVIYRSKWAPSQYVRINPSPYGASPFADDPAMNDGSARYPAKNPYGYAFNQDWLQPQNKVGTVGPLPDVPDGMGEWEFQVHRDLTRRNVLHIVIAAHWPTEGYRIFRKIQRVYFATSVDNGMTFHFGQGDFSLDM